MDFQPGTFTIRNDNWPHDPKFQDFVVFLGLKLEKDKKGVVWPYSDKVAQKVEDLYMWGKVKSNSLEHDDIKKTIYQLVKTVGVNYIGETLLDRLWQHTQFDSRLNSGDIKRLQKEEEKSKNINEGKKIKLEKSSNTPPEKSIPSTVKPIRERNVKFGWKPQNDIHIINKKPIKYITEEI